MLSYKAARRAYEALDRRNRFLQHESKLLPDTVDENLLEMKHNVEMMAKLLGSMVEIKGLETA